MTIISIKSQILDIRSENAKLSIITRSADSTESEQTVARMKLSRNCDKLIGLISSLQILEERLAGM